MFYEVIPATTLRAAQQVLTYSSDLSLSPGHLVLIPLGRRTVVGVVLRSVAAVDFPTKAILRLLHPRPLPAHLLASARWLADYYLSPLSATIGLMFPSNLPQTPRGEKTSAAAIASTPVAASAAPPALPPLSPAQQTALAAILASPNPTTLLRGITGSGKTNLYLHLAARTMFPPPPSNRGDSQNGSSVILLVPEIALTSQIVQVFRQTFGEKVLLLHSQQTSTERRATWLQIHESSSPLIVIGPRSALSVPLHQLGLILIDESHESAYYQENTPRYSAPRLASFIAGRLKIPCLLGSATPNLVDYHLATTKKSLVELDVKAKTTAIAPEVTIIDLKNRSDFTKNRYFSDLLLTKIQNNLEQGHQTLIFHNRRGSAPLTLCESCGWQALCPNCYLPMTLHTDSYTLSCHLCGHSEPVPSCCPNCQHAGIVHKGFGTKLLESELHKLFPQARLARFDGDNSKQESLSGLYHDVQTGAINLLIGTQTLARGLDLPHLATVGIVQADAGLALPDYAAEERTFELLTQVIGRVGRGHLDLAEVIIQTYQPDSPIITAAAQADFPNFANHLLQKRRHAKLPPFAYLARLSVTYKTERTTLAKIRQAYRTLQQNPALIVAPPAPAFHEHTGRGFTWQIVIKSTSRRQLLDALAPFAAMNGYAIVLDPPSLL